MSLCQYRFDGSKLSTEEYLRTYKLLDSLCWTGCIDDVPPGCKCFFCDFPDEFKISELELPKELLVHRIK